MDETIQTIESQGKKFLADTLKKFSNTTIFEYSQELQSHHPSNDIEQELLSAFREEMEERKFLEEDIARVIFSLKNKRILQTSPHTSLVPNPRMFCIDWLSTRSLTQDEPYIVCSFSGIPFSNSSKPGRIHSHHTTINFVPSKHQDALVYSAPIFTEQNNLMGNLPGSVSIPSPHSHTRFSDWACETSQELHRKTIYPHTIYLDINKIITRYLLKILDNKEHSIHKLLFDEEVRVLFNKNFGEAIHLFYSEYDSKKYIKQESLFFDGYTLKGNHTQIRLQPDELRKELENLTLCPAPIIVFTILTFINDCKCLGSFMQIEYLSDFKEKWIQTKLFHSSIENRKTKNLSTGQFPNFQGNALDFLETRPELTNLEQPMETLWKPLSNLFTQ